MVLVLAATNDAAERCPSRRHWLVSSTRRANRVRATAANRSTAATRSSTFAACSPLMQRGSKPSTPSRRALTA